MRWSAAGGRRSIPRLGAEEKVEWSTQPTNGIALLLTKNPPTNGVVFLLAGGPQRAVKPAQTPQKKIKSACGCCLPPCHAITSRASQGIHGLPSEEAYSSSFGKASNPINDRKGQTCSSSSSSRRLRCFVAETGCEKNCPLLPRFLQKKKKKNRYVRTRCSFPPHDHHHITHSSRVSDKNNVGRRQATSNRHYINLNLNFSLGTIVVCR